MLYKNKLKLKKLKFCQVLVDSWNTLCGHYPTFIFYPPMTNSIRVGQQSFFLLKLYLISIFVTNIIWFPTTLLLDLVCNLSYHNYPQPGIDEPNCFETRARTGIWQRLRPKPRLRHAPNWDQAQVCFGHLFSNVDVTKSHYFQKWMIK